MATRVLNVMGRLRDVGIVTECASLVNRCVSVKVVIIPITVKRARCEPRDESDGNTTDNEQEARESLPLAPRNADTIDSSTDSDDSDHDADDSYVYGTSQIIIVY